MGNSRRVDVRSGGPPAPSPRSPQVPLAFPDSSTEETWWPEMDGQADRCLARGLEYSRRDGNRTPLHPNICQSRDPRAAEKRSSCRVRRSRKNQRASECQEPSLKQKSCMEGFFLSVPSELGPDPPRAPHLGSWSRSPSPPVRRTEKRFTDSPHGPPLSPPDLVFEGMRCNPQRVAPGKFFWQNMRVSPSCPAKAVFENASTANNSAFPPRGRRVGEAGGWE